MPNERLTPIQRLLSKVVCDITTKCWLWQACKLPIKNGHGGYGFFRLNGRTILAHRTSWMLHKGEIPDDLDVLHTCDMPDCINPDHLWLGDDFDNVADKTKKGRCNYINAPRGEDSGPSKLTEKQVIEIRGMVAAGFRDGEIGKIFNSCRENIGQIRRRKTWRHLP